MRTIRWQESGSVKDRSQYTLDPLHACTVKRYSFPIRRKQTTNRSLLALAALAISFAVPAFAQQKDTVDPQLLEQINNTISKKYDEAVDNNDAAAVAALYTEDAVFVADTGPIYGREAIEKWYADVFKVWHPKNHTVKRDQDSVHSLVTAGNEAWDHGEWSETGQGQNGEPIQVKGYWSAIDTREGDVWKIRMLT
jgi:uncharacterized protein (TIGR02246 family)